MIFIKKKNIKQKVKLLNKKSEIVKIHIIMIWNIHTLYNGSLLIKKYVYVSGC